MRSKKKRRGFSLSLSLLMKNEEYFLLSLKFQGCALSKAKRPKSQGHTYFCVRQKLDRGDFPGDFPGGAVVENLPANAGDTGSSPGLGRSHMPRSNWAREPQLPSLRVWSLCSATREAAIMRGPRTTMKSGPRLPQLEKALTQKRRPNTAKNKNK